MYSGVLAPRESGAEPSKEKRLIIRDVRTYIYRVDHFVA